MDVIHASLAIQCLEILAYNAHSLQESMVHALDVAPGLKARYSDVPIVTQLQIIIRFYSQAAVYRVLDAFKSIPMDFVCIVKANFTKKIIYAMHAMPVVVHVRIVIIA